MNSASFGLTLSVGICYFECKNITASVCQTRIIEYDKDYDSDNKSTSYYHLINHKWHRDDGPVCVNRKFESGKLVSEIKSYDNYFLGTKKITAWNMYSEDNIMLEVRYTKNCKMHMETGPAIIRYKSIQGKMQKILEQYHINDMRHRMNGPARIEYEFVNAKMKITCKKYYLCGKLHRENGPAITEYRFSDGILTSNTETYYKNNLIHREAGPAKIKNTYKDGKIHTIEQWFYINGTVI